MKSIIIILIALLCFSPSSSQEIKEVNSDVILQTGLSFYRNAEFEVALRYANKGIELAPLYHDIRLLRIRCALRLNLLDLAEKDLYFMVEKAPEYPGTNDLLKQLVQIMDNKEAALSFIEKLPEKFSTNVDFMILKAQLKLELNDSSGARSLAEKINREEKLNGAQRYIIDQILRNTIKSEIAISYETVDFNEDYNNRPTWHTNRIEYKHTIKKTVLLGRVSYTDRRITDGLLYEFESYPYLSEKAYLFVNLGLSNGTVFPEVRTSTSLFYNVAKGLELELGGRMLSFDQEEYFTGITGVSTYLGKTYLNFRAALGPVREKKVVQNYQFNTRYYFKGQDNYLSLRLSRGISPDESILFTQVQENPQLKVNFMGLGVNALFGFKHVIQINGGILFEEITPTRSDRQLLVSIRYGYRL